MRIDPEKMPAAPTPATARPTIKVIELGERAQIREPTSNREMADKNTHLIG
jgi:hypothetical protein